VMTAVSRRMVYTPRSAKPRGRLLRDPGDREWHRAEAAHTAPSTGIGSCLLGKDAHDEHDHDTGRR
jgi:hypothetical protein